MQQVEGSHGKELAHRQGGGELSSTQKVLGTHFLGHSMVTGALPWKKDGAGVSPGSDMVSTTLVCNSASSAPLGFMGISSRPGSGP